MIRVLVGKLKGTKEVEEQNIEPTERELILLNGDTDRIDYGRSTNERG